MVINNKPYYALNAPPKLYVPRAPIMLNQCAVKLTELDFGVERSRSYTWVVARKPCSEAVNEVARVVEEVMSEEGGGGWKH